MKWSVTDMASTRDGVPWYDRFGVPGYGDRGVTGIEIMAMMGGARRSARLAVVDMFEVDGVFVCFAEGR